MNFNTYIEAAFQPELIKEGFTSEFVFGQIPLFKTKKQISVEKLNDQQLGQKARSIKLNTQICTIDYDTAVIMNQFFNEYFNSVNNKQTADLHGAHIIIIRSSCPNYINIEGIVVQETPTQLQVVNKLRSYVINKKVVDWMVGKVYFVGKLRNQRHKTQKRWDLNL